MNAFSSAFVHQLTGAQFALFSYILLLTGNPADARDVLQDTNMVILRDVSHFKPGTSFLAWAKTVAYYQVLSYRKKKSRDRLVFDDESFRRLTERVAARSEQSDRRLEVITYCIKKLSEAQQALIKAKYFEGLSIREIGKRFGYSASAAVSLLYRIRRLLAACVQHAMGHETL